MHTSGFDYTYHYASLDEAFQQQPPRSISRIQLEYAEESIVFFLLKGHKEGPVAWIQAALHGDEYDGVAACLDFVDKLDLDKLSGSVVLCPIVNYSAFASGKAAHPADGVNLNRVFRSDAQSTSHSFLYGKWLADQIAAYADLFIDLHGGGQFLDVCPFAMVADPDPEAYQTAVSLLQRLELTAIYHGGNNIKGMLIYEMCKRGIPAVLLESGGGITWKQRAVDSHVQHLFALMAGMNMIMDELEFGDSKQDPALPVTEVVELYAPVTGLQKSQLAVGDHVTLGDSIIEIVDYPQFQIHQITNPVSKGIILSIHTASFIQRGDYAVMIGVLQEQTDKG